MGVAGPSGAEGPPASVPLEGPAAPGDMPAAEQPQPPVVVVACDESTVGGNSPNTLSVNVSAAQQPVGKELFGVLMETLGRDVNGGLYVGRTSPIPNTNGLRNDIVQGFAEAGVGIVQWPGGCAANNYNWAPNTNPANTMGTDLFMEFTTTIGAEPYLTGRPQPRRVHRFHFNHTAAGTRPRSSTCVTSIVRSSGQSENTMRMPPSGLCSIIFWPIFPKKEGGPFRRPATTAMYCLPSTE